MTHEDQSWHARGERNGLDDYRNGRRYRVTAVGPCAAYARGYEAGMRFAEEEAKVLAK